MDDAEASVDNGLGGLELVQLVGQQHVGLHLEHAITVSLNLVSPADVLPQKTNSPIPGEKKLKSCCNPSFNYISDLC